MKITQAKDQARPADRPRRASALKDGQADEPAATGSGASTGPADVIPLARSRRRWSVRVHWGIIFAVVASLILWFAIKTVVDLAF